MKKIISIFLTLAMTLALLAGCGAGTADSPATLSSAGNFAKWFQADKDSALSNITEPGAYYFKLGSDVTVGQAGQISGGHTVVIDLNGHTLSAKDQQVFDITGGKLTLKNGTVESTGADADGGVIAITGEDSALVLEDVKMSNTDDSTINEKLLGGVIYASGNYEKPVTVTLKGNTEINGSASGFRDCGGAVAMMGNSQLYITSGTVQNGKAGSGGNIYADEQAQVHISGGAVTGGEALVTSAVTGDGGNISVCDQAQLHLAAGTISGGIAGNNGGNVSVASYNKTEDNGFFQYGGVIEGGKAVGTGGNIYAVEKSSLVVLAGGEVRDGEASQGGNVGVKAATLELRGSNLTGLQDSETMYVGGNIYAEAGIISLFDGQITNGWAIGSGGNIYGENTALYMYGGSITYGSSGGSGMNVGGGNVFLAGGSVFDMYNGEIALGEANRGADEGVATGPNVMILGNTKMQMFGGTIRDGIANGASARGHCVVINGQEDGSLTEFHAYGGTLENDSSMGEKGYGHIVAAYSNTKSSAGLGIARLFAGTVNYKGSSEPIVIEQTLWGSMGYAKNPINMFVFNPEYAELTRDGQVGDCADDSHNTKVEDVAATCVTPGYTKYHCDTCGDWCEVTSEATGHNDTATAVEATEQTGAYTQHSCDACGSAWRTAA